MINMQPKLINIETLKCKRNNTFLFGLLSVRKKNLFGLLSEKKSFYLVCCLRKKNPSVWFAVWEKILPFGLLFLRKTFCLVYCLCENWCLADCLCENRYLWCWCRLWTKVSLWDLVSVNLGHKIVLMVDEWWRRDVGYFVMDLCV